MKTRYLHTLLGNPAYYDGYQICYMRNGDTLKLSTSLQQIRREQRASLRWRKGMNFSDRASEYGYLRLRVDRDA